MKEKISEFKILFSNKKYLWSFAVSIIFLAAALIINFYAGMYATKSASSSVTDIILSNTRAYDLDGVFIYGTFLLIFFIVFLSFYKPRRVPFVAKSVALFVIIRSAFVTMTHLGPFPSQIAIHSDILSKLTFGGDLFFSGHTGMPFLMALIFWQNKILRYVFICISVGFGIVVLLAHLHYTIDVMSAFFITYSIFHICEYFFKKDRKLFFTGDVNQMDTSILN
jgi:hypothetical protein